MLGTLSLFLLLTCASAAPKQGCRSKTPVPAADCPQTTSYLTEPIPQGSYDEGHARMERLMRWKVSQRERVHQCRAEGTCPQYDIPEAGGYAECEDGLADGYDCMNVDRWSFTPINVLNGGDEREMDCNDIWGWHDEVTDDNYAIVGLTGGTSFVRVTDPEHPFIVGFMETNGEFTTWRDMKVNRDHAYIVSEGSVHGMQVFDLTRLRDVEEFQLFSPDFLFDKFGNSHNIAVHNEVDHVYVIGATNTEEWEENCAQQGGLIMIDVSEPLEPVISGCFDGDGYVHDTECIIYDGPDEEHEGKEICFGYNEDSLTVMDVTDRQDVKMLARATYEGYGYTHQGWITEDHTLLLLDDEADEFFTEDRLTRTYVWDVSNLTNPVLQRTYCSSERSIDHNQYIRRFNRGQGNQYDLTFQSNYFAGFRILHILEEEWDLEEVGYFGMYQNRTDDVTFSGTWSNYVYWEDPEVLAVTSIDFGLFMLRPDYKTMESMMGC